MKIFNRMKPSIELPLTRKKRLQQKITTIDDPDDSDCQLNLDPFKNKLFGHFHFKKDMARKFLSQMVKKKHNQRVAKRISPSKVQRPIKTKIVYRPIQPKKSPHPVAAHTFRTASHMEEVHLSSHGGLREVCPLNKPPNTLGEQDAFAKSPHTSVGSKTVNVPSAIKELKITSTSLGKGEAFAKSPHSPTMQKTAEVPPAIKELFKSRPTIICKAEPFASRSGPKKLEVIEERASPPVLVGPFEVRSGPIFGKAAIETRATPVPVGPSPGHWAPAQPLKTRLASRSDAQELEAIGETAIPLLLVGPFEVRSGPIFGKSAIEPIASHPVLITPFESRPGHWGRAQPLKTIPVSLKKVEPFETSRYPGIEPKIASFVKVDPFETVSYQLEDEDRFESTSSPLKKLRSALQANIPKQVNSSQMREITAAVKEAIQKATDNL